MASQDKSGIQSMVFFLVVVLALTVALSVAFYGGQLITNLVSSPLNIITLVLVLVVLYVLFTQPFFLILRDYERAVVFRLGNFLGVYGPGLTFFIPGVDTFRKLDIRTKTLDLPKQDIITKDRIEAKVDAVIYLTIKDPKLAVLNVDDYEQAVKLFVISSLRDKTGAMTIESVIAERESLAHSLSETLNKAAKEWGVKATVELKDVDLPATIVSAMHEARAAQRRKEAMITLAEGKQIEIEKIREATNKMTDENIVYYYLETLQKLAAGKASKLVVPMELTKIGNFFQGKIPSKEEAKVEDLIEKYAGLIRGAAEGEAPKKVQEAIITAPETEELAKKKADQLFKSKYDLLKKKKKEKKKK